MKMSSERESQDFDILPKKRRVISNNQKVANLDAEFMQQKFLGQNINLLKRERGRKWAASSRRNFKDSHYEIKCGESEETKCSWLYLAGNQLW